MRQDAKNLLDRLNRQQFRYQDFTEAADEIELWPLFQALLRDPRIVGVSPAPDLVAAATASARPVEATPALPSDTVAARAPHDARHNLFARYRSEPEVAEPAEREPDLRRFLKTIGGDRA